MLVKLNMSTLEKINQASLRCSLGATRSALNPRSPSDYSHLSVDLNIMGDSLLGLLGRPGLNGWCLRWPGFRRSAGFGLTGTNSIFLAVSCSICASVCLARQIWVVGGDLAVGSRDHIKPLAADGRNDADAVASNHSLAASFRYPTPIVPCILVKTLVLLRDDNAATLPFPFLKMSSLDRGVAVMLGCVDG